MTTFVSELSSGEETNLTTANIAASELTAVTEQVGSYVNSSNTSTETSTTKNRDTFVREQVDPDTTASIPIVYGTAYLGGIITDARMINNNQTMWYCITICEKTGALINGTPSIIRPEEVYWNGLKVTFQSDGVTVESTSDEEDNVDVRLRGLVKIYFYNNGSDNPIGVGYNGAYVSAPAYSLFPEWTSEHQMTDLIFALVRVDYNYEAGSTGLGNIRFKMQNTMSQPGDVINDYMTNTRYGAGILPEEINQ